MSTSGLIPSRVSRARSLAKLAAAGARSGLPPWARAAVSAGLLAGAALKLDAASVFERIGGVSPAPALAALALASAGQALCGLRWRRLVIGAGAPAQRLPSDFAFARCYLRAALWNNVLPSGYGGDAVKVNWLRAHVDLRRAAATVLGDRLLGFALLALAAAVSLPFTRYSLARPLVVGTALLAVGMMIATVIAGRARALRAALALGGLYVALWCASLWLLARSLALHLEPAATAPVLLVAGVAAALPVALGGIGTREAGFVAALTPLGQSPTDAVALGLAFGALLAVAAAPGVVAPDALRRERRAAARFARWRARCSSGRARFASLTKGHLSVLGLLLAAGLALRLLLAERSLWLDETITFAQVARPLDEVVRLQLSGVHPPLYHLQAALAVDLLGRSELALRLPSIVWSLVAVVACWAWARQAFPRLSPWPATALAALAPFPVWYGSEARMYAQVFALVALAGGLAWRFLERGGWYRATALALTLCALAYTHYFGALFGAALGVVAAVLAATRADLRKRALAVLGCLAIAALSLLPWLLAAFLGRDATSQLPPYKRPDPFSVIIAVVELVAGFHDYRAIGLAAATWPLALLALLLAVPQLARVPVSVGALITLTLLPVASLVGASWLGPRSVFDPRYLTVIAPPLFLLVGALVAQTGRRLAGNLRLLAAFAVAVLLVSLSVIQGQDRGNPRLFQLREALQAAAQATAPGDALALVPQFPLTNLHYDPVLAYYRPPRSRRVIDTLNGPGRRPREAWTMAARSGSRRIALVTTFEGQALSQGLASPSRFVQAFRSYGPLLEKRSFAGVQVRVYALPRAATRPVRTAARAGHGAIDRKEAR
ncbi:lysylphosphatidylglycerol synthase domain-containing protein [Thermoleophilum album]|uniref:Lysylphosphatidylglycerol synthase TM region n=1 Tax=Thermoleophilum album TaxID=29539 RepID=A0A1H6FKA4_THEAL|nr:lysylphosphatidylglycerol synthase domain-containing protein [Thermoleophilum album]SEH10244.1 Lysylphosphatidylglycerol synthase TM region [Thermoleophilum album]